MLYNCDQPIGIVRQNEAKRKNSRFSWLRLSSCPLALIFIGWTNHTASAQIVPDNTLPQNSVVTPNGDIIEIQGGTIQGNNLFHSFEQFSVLVNQEAFFNNATTIENIIGRVTGSSISEIDGLIRANGAADLFLINPNGIVFGENATLDIGGSFIGSTADSIDFADGTEFSAVNPDASPLLTVSIPVGLQYGQENGDITVEGAGNNLFIDFDTFTVDRFDRPEGLVVQPEKTLALVGGNIFLDGGNLTASQGNIELGSVADGTVQLIPDEVGWKLGYESISDFQEIALSQAASLEASGNSGGRVNITGDFVSLTDGSAILTDTLGDGTGGSLTIEAEETEIFGAAENGFTSSLFVNVDLGATGDGGELLINTGYLYIGDGAQVNVNTFGLGNAGTLTVKAGDIEILGGSVDGELPSGLFAQADIGETGTGGNIDIEADYLLVADGANINVSTFGEADAGNLTIKAQEIELIAGAPGFGSSGLFANSEDLGNGGNLTIESDYLLVADGAQIIAATFFDGDAGNLTINSDEIELTGTSPGGIGSGLFSTVEEGGTGNGGSLQINATNLLVADGAQIAVSTAGSGNSGILNINASTVELVGFSNSGASGLFSSAIIGSGNGGDINLTSDRLSITDGATISASNFASRNSDTPPGTGTAGNIQIDVNSIELDSSIAEEFSTITAAAFAQAGGDITLNVDSNLALGNGSQISAETRGDGDGGSINISADQFNLNTQGQVSVNSTGLGQAGDIAIASNSLTLNEGQITATSTQTEGGEINLATDSLSLDNNSLISTSVLGGAGEGGSVTLDVDSDITLTNGSQISSETRGTGDGGNIELIADTLELNSGGQFSTNTAAGGNAGNINLTLDWANFSDAGSGVFSEVEATATGNGGSIDISADKFDLKDLAQVSVNSTGLGQAGDITLTSNSLNLNQGKITATSVQTGGGEINLVTDSIFLDRNSLISTSVLDSSGGGGNIFIDNRNFIIGQNNSDIRANAVFGQGGNIQINSTGIFLDLDSEITASSEFGVDGVVEINSTESDKKIGTAQLPNKITSPEAVITSSCPVPETNTFVLAGSGGLPENPSSDLRGEVIWQDIRIPQARKAESRANSLPVSEHSKKSTIIEAQGWIITQQGKVELIAGRAQPNLNQNVHSCF